MNIPFIDIHTHHPSNSTDILSVPSLFLQDVDFKNELTTPFTAAVHPWHAACFSPQQVSVMLGNLTTQSGLIAIGETGLDAVCTADYQLQKQIFELHLQFAENHHLPVIIHGVKAWNDLIAYFKRYKISFVLHGYSAGFELTKQLIDLGCYFSIGKSVLQISPRFRKALQIIPLTSIFLETDDSSVSIKDIYQEVSNVKEVEFDDFKIQINRNFRNLFFSD